MTYNQIVLVTFVALLVLASLIAFFLYRKDKKMAKGNTPVRIKEKTLLEIAVLGGALGAFLGRIIFRHKTDKIYFTITIYLSLLLQIAALAILVYAAVRG